MKCPLFPNSKATELLRCPVRKCLYFSEESENNCRYSKLQSLPEDPAKRKEALQKAFKITDKDLKSGVERVHAFLTANAFFEYLFGDDITESKHYQLDILENSASKYASWKPGVPKPEFQKVIEAVNYLRNNLV